ncbi:MAG: transcriptional regulator [Desulfobulbaceae bacterium]|nr:transcriptional regulator [Desulfobulbaceae bacterium]
MVKIKSGGAKEFFKSALETAREIDRGNHVTAKHTIFVEADDLAALLKAERRELIQFLRGQKKVLFPTLIKKMRRAQITLNKDLAVLERCSLVKVEQEVNPGHGRRKVIIPLYGKQPLEFKAIV